MIIILERFNALVPLFMTFRFQLYIIYNFSKIRSGRALLLPMRSCSARTLPTIQNPRYWFCGYNRLNAYLLPYSIEGINKCVCVLVNNYL